MARAKNPWLIVGAVERVGLTGLIGEHTLKAKVDTGARTSALHVDDLKFLSRGRVRFTVEHESGTGAPVEAKVTRTSAVTSSSGQSEVRPFIETELVLGPLVRTIEVSLSSRAHMRYPMLLGREAIAGDCLVDPGRRLVLKAFTKGATRGTKKKSKKKTRRSS